MKPSKRVIPALVTLALACFAGAAYATPVTYNLTLTSNSPVGLSGTGYFTIDGPVNPSAIQTFSVSNGGLLALQFNIGGHTFSLANASSTSSGPSIYFVLGGISSIGYAGGTADLGLTTFGTGYTYFDFSNGYPGIRSNGRISYALAPPPANPAPEPLTLALVGAGLAGMGALRSRRKAA